MSQLPAIQVVMPLLAAPLCVVLRREGLARMFASVTCWATFAVAVLQWRHVSDEPSLSYTMGGWLPAFGIEYRVDSATVLLLLIVSGLASLIVPLGPGERSHAVPEGRGALFYAAMMLCLAGLLGMTMTGDAFNVFVFLEIASLATYTLIAMGKSRRALRAAMNYLILGTLGGTFILIAIGLVYQLTGTLNMALLRQRLPAAAESHTMLLAYSFLATGMGLKLAVVPLHQWLPNAYTYAPASVSAFLSGTATKVMFYLLLRFTFGIFGAAYVFGALGFGGVLTLLSLVGMFGGSLAAIYQTDLKRLLAYSSVAQVGYLTLGMSLGTESGVTAGLLHVFNHALMKTGLFLVASALVLRLGTSELSALRGRGKQLPVTMTAFVVGGLAMIGVPGTVGFVSKWYLVLAALDERRYVVAFAILLSSLLAVAYVWKVIEIAFFDRPGSNAKVSDAPLSLALPTCLTLAASVYFGIWTEIPVELASQAAASLVGGGK